MVQELIQKRAAVLDAEQDFKAAQVNLLVAQASAKTARALVKESAASEAHAAALKKFHEEEFDRYKLLAQRDAVVATVLDEKLRNLEAAAADYQTAQAATDTAKAKADEFSAKVDAARVDIDVKSAKVTFAEADRDHAQAMVEFTKIRAPFNGLVVSRKVDPGSFVQNASTGNPTPMLRVLRMDIVTLHTWIPEKCAPFVNKNTEAIIKLNALEDQEIHTKITRYSHWLDPDNGRDMRVEVDFDNKDGRLKPGMYGDMTLLLEDFSQSRLVPAGAVVASANHSYIFEVRDGRAIRVPVRVQYEDGVQAKIVKVLRSIDPKTGRTVEKYEELTDRDEIVRSGQGELADGQPVRTVRRELVGPVPLVTGTNGAGPIRRRRSRKEARMGHDKPHWEDKDRTLAAGPVRRRRILAALGGLIALLAGCATPPRDPPAMNSTVAQPSAASPVDGVSRPIVSPQPVPASGSAGGPQNVGELIQPGGLMSPVRLAAFDAERNQSAPAVTNNAPLPPSSAPTSSDPMPIDLPTALRLVNANSPTIALARDRVREAYLTQRQAELAWLPDLRAGPTYDRHDGRDQNSNGTIFEVSKQNLFINGGVELDWNTSELLFGRLAAQRLSEAAQADARAVTSNVQLDVALAYLDLLRVYGEIAIFADALARAEEMLHNAESAEKAGLSKTTADINRARTEVDLRREREFQLQAEVAVASARLARLLLLRPTVVLKPTDARILPLGLIPDVDKLDDLVSVGLSNRPELQQDRASGRGRDDTLAAGSNRSVDSSSRPGLRWRGIWRRRQRPDGKFWRS